MRPDTAAHNPAAYNRRFTARFAVMLVLLVMGYMFAVTFMDVKGAKYADMIVPFLLGTVLGAVVGFSFQITKAKDPEQPPEAAAPPPSVDVEVKP